MITENREIDFKEILLATKLDLKKIKKGSVVALIGDFEPITLNILFRLIELNCIIVPLTENNKLMHEYFFENAFVDYIIKSEKIIKRNFNNKNKLIENLRSKDKPGLILFSSGTTSKPKAILHDFSFFFDSLKKKEKH